MSILTNTNGQVYLSSDGKALNGICPYDIVQTTGQSTTAVMSQKATTDKIDEIKSDLGQLSEAIADLSGAKGLYVSMPDYVNVKTTSEFKVYYRNILTRDDVMLWVGYHNSLTTRYYDDYLSITATAEGIFALPWKVYDKGYNLLESGSLNVIATAKVPIDTTKVMVIGDSTVSAVTMQSKTAALYAENGATLSLLGTRGGTAHEGRGGWTAENYCTAASKNGETNPFYNDGFDFAYYMANQNYTDVHAVVIQLGINDVFMLRSTNYDSTSILSYFNQMVASILAYNADVKVIINLPITPNSNGTSFTETYGTNPMFYSYNRDVIRFAKDLKDYFTNNARVTVSGANCILDTKTQIRDGVHPTEEGYNALGQRLFEVLVSVTDGTAYIVPLLNILERARVKHTTNTISANMARELDPTKCYDSSYVGVRSAGVTNVLTYTPISENSFSLSLSGGASGGNGVEFPVPQLEVGKTYTFKYTSDQSEQRVYLIKYNSDTTYNSNTVLGQNIGNKTVTITPEEGFIYSIQFTILAKDKVGTYTNISLTEN